MARKTLGNGQGGKSLNDRKLAAEVRTLTLKELKGVLRQKGMTEMKKQILLRLASTVLPRLNEHTGEDGSALKVVFDPAFKTDAAT